METQLTYHLQVTSCGKERCQKCRSGQGHGPYWYAYRTEGGRTIRTYVGKTLPPGVRPSPTMAPFQERGPASSTSSPAEQAKAPPLLRIRTLGQFRLERPGDQEWCPVDDDAWGHHRVRSLLACLICSPGRKIGREQLMEALWPEADFRTAADRLDRAVYTLRRVFEPMRLRPASSPLLLTDRREVLALADQSLVWIDADAFLERLREARASPDPGVQERLFEEAAGLYGGDFLPEERQVGRTQRASLRRSWVGLFLDLADLRIARGALSGAVELLDRLLARDPANEAAAERLIRVLAQLGRRTEALEAYKRLASTLEREYRISPLPATRALYNTVRLGGDETLSPAGEALPSRPGSAGDHARTRPAGQTSPARTQEHSAPAPAPFGRSHQRPLVGRVQELTILRTLLVMTERAAGIELPSQKKAAARPFDLPRHPQAVLLTGEVGIGKTRLAEEAGCLARKRGWVVAWSRVYAQESGIPYCPWIEVLRKAMSQGVWERQELTRRSLIYQPLLALLPELHEMMPEVELSTPLSSSHSEQRLWDGIRELLTTVSRGAPLLIVLDDVQWADGTSGELFAHLARRLSGLPIVLVGTCRENELPQGHPLRSLLAELERERAVEVVPVSPLADAEIGTLVADLPQALVRSVQHRARGNPYFAEELARTLEVTGGDESLLSAPDQPLPEQIKLALGLRLSRLGSACQRFLSKAAVLGSSFDLQVIAAMEETPSSGPSTASEEGVLTLLEEALGSGMLMEEGNGGRTTYQFWHPLLASYFYEQLSLARRASFHRRAALVFQQLYRGREQEGAATIVHHLERGGAGGGLIAHYAELAGDRAYALFAYPEAERHYRLALAHQEEARREEPAEAVEGDEGLHRSYLLERLADCLRNLGRYEEGRSLFERALSERASRTAFSSEEEAGEEAQVRALLWGELCWSWYYVADTLRARQCIDRGKELLREAGASTGPAWAYLGYQQSFIDCMEGKYEAARAAASEALHFFEATGREQQREPPDGLSPVRRLTPTRGTLAGDPVNVGRVHKILGNICTAQGRLAESAAHAGQALAIFEVQGYWRGVTHVCCDLGDLYLRQAEHALARSYLERSLSFAERMGDRPSVAVALANLGILAAREASPGEAETFFKRGLEIVEEIGDGVYASSWQALLSGVYLKQGRLAEAGESCRRALVLGRSKRNAPCIGKALIALGQLRVAQALAEGEPPVPTSGRSRNPVEGERSGLTAGGTGILLRAAATIRRALGLPGLEVEDGVEAHLVLAEIAWLLGELPTAHEEIERTLEEAARYELRWLYARASELAGVILATLGEQRRAVQRFEQALEVFCGQQMDTECRRSLAVARSYGGSLFEEKERELSTV